MKTYDLFGERPEKPPKFFQSPMPSDVTGGRTTKGRKRQGETGLRRQVSLNPSTYLSAASRARIFHWQERARALTARGAVYGGSSTDLSVNFDPDTSVWKTSLPSLFGGFLPYSERFPASGMMRNGRLYRRPRLVPRTLENDSFLWPTPTVAEMKTGCGYQQANGKDYPTLTGLAGAAPARGGKMWPTPKGSPETMAKNARPLNETVTNGAGGQLNPTWVEWLMGFPAGWTDLEDSATP